MSLILSSNKILKNELVDYVFQNEKNFFNDWIADNNFENYQEFLNSCSENAYVKAYCVRYGKRETRKMLKEAFGDSAIDHQLICEL